MMESLTEESKPFRLFCMKEPDYVMMIMASWMTLNELEGGNETGLEGKWSSKVETVYVQTAVWIGLALSSSS